MSDLPATIGKTIDAMSKLKDAIRVIEQKAKPLRDSYNELEDHLKEMMVKEEQTKAAGKNASVTLSKNLVPSVEDWESFYAFIGKKKYYHLLERRPSVSGCRELFEQKQNVPGVVPVPVVTIRFTQLKG